MLPDVPTNLDRYFDVAEHAALRASLLIFLVLALYRLVAREWRNQQRDGGGEGRHRQPSGTARALKPLK